MPRKRKQDFANSIYGQAKGSSSIPAKIKCLKCGIVKPSANFSKKRLADLVDALAGTSRDPTVAKIIACIPCNDTTVNELQCQQCDKWLVLSRFSKTQRRNGDMALCFKCSEDRQNVDPAGDSSGGGSDSDGSSDSEEFEYGSATIATATATATSLSNMSLEPPSTGGYTSRITTASNSAALHGRASGTASKTPAPMASSRFTRVPISSRSSSDENTPSPKRPNVAEKSILYDDSALDDVQVEASDDSDDDYNYDSC